MILNLLNSKIIEFNNGTDNDTGTNTNANNGKLYELFFYNDKLANIATISDLVFYHVTKKNYNKHETNIFKLTDDIICAHNMPMSVKKHFIANNILNSECVDNHIKKWYITNLDSNDFIKSPKFLNLFDWYFLNTDPQYATSIFIKNCKKIKRKYYDITRYNHICEKLIKKILDTEYVEKNMRIFYRKLCVFFGINEFLITKNIAHYHMQDIMDNIMQYVSFMIYDDANF